MQRPAPQPGERDSVRVGVVGLLRPLPKAFERRLDKRGGPSRGGPSPPLPFDFFVFCRWVAEADLRLRPVDTSSGDVAPSALLRGLARATVIRRVAAVGGLLQLVGERGRMCRMQAMLRLLKCVCAAFGKLLRPRQWLVVEPVLGDDRYQQPVL